MRLEQGKGKGKAKGRMLTETLKRVPLPPSFLLSSKKPRRYDTSESCGNCALGLGEEGKQLSFPGAQPHGKGGGRREGGCEQRGHELTLPGQALLGSRV